MMRLIYAICVLVFYGLLIFPALQYSFDLFPRKGLTNVTVKRALPKLTFESFSTGQFQKAFDVWVTRNNGFFGYLVRFENQINFSVFCQISATYVSSVKLGRDNFLFQTVYLDDLNGKSIASDEDLKREVSRLTRLKDFAKSRGKAVLVVITPNKIFHDISIVQDRYLNSNHGVFVRSYDRMVEMLEEAGIDYIDGPKLFHGYTEGRDTPLFTPTGSHYNSLGACLISREITTRLAASLDRPMRRFDCAGEVTWLEKPRGPDRDLTKMVNLWWPELTFIRTPYVSPRLEEQDEVFRPKVLFIGTSFMWSVFDVLERVGAYSRRFFFYYHNTNYYYYRDRKGSRKRGKQGVQRSTLDWEKFVFSNDAIVLEANQSVIHSLGFGFLEGFEKWQKETQGANES